MDDNDEAPSTTTTTTVAPSAPARTDSCCCGEPAGASLTVKMTRAIAFTIIFVQAIVFAVWGYMNFAQCIGSLVGIVMASFLLCITNSCCYITAAFIFLIGSIFNIAAMVFWIQFAEDYEEHASSYYENPYYETWFGAQIYLDPDFNWVKISKGLAVPPIIAAILMVVGAAFATSGALTLDEKGTQADLNKAFKNPHHISRKIEPYSTIAVSNVEPSAAAADAVTPPDVA